MSVRSIRVGGWQADSVELDVQRLARFGGTHDIFLVSDYDSWLSGIFGLLDDLFNCWEQLYIVNHYICVYATSSLTVQIFRKHEEYEKIF